MRIYKPTNSIIDFIKSFEGFFAHAYLDAGGVWTIGWGTTIYPSGKRVKQGETCTTEQAHEWVEWEANMKAMAICALINGVEVTQNQFDALVSFAYNLGVGALGSSTLLRKLKKNPMDETIYNYAKDEKGKPVVKSCEFLKWVLCNSKVLPGLVRRRAAEANLYAKPLIK